MLALKSCAAAVRVMFASGPLLAASRTRNIPSLIMATTIFTKKTLGLESGKPGGDSMTGSPATTFPKKPKIGASKSKKREIPEGLWTKCPKCSVMLYDKELDENLKTCLHCNHHFPITARERINSLVETCSFEEMDAEMISVDMLKFTGVASYESK